MTIPELEADLRALREGMNELDGENRRLRDDVAELRCQLGVERAAKCKDENAREVPPPRRF